MVQRWGGLDIAIHGLSFAKPQAPETLLPKYKLPEPGAVNIGIMHTSLGGAPGHDQYAPTNVADLLAAGFDYWALGHIHKRAAHDDKRPVIMPGMPQGRDINEAGEKTVTLVTVHDDRSILVEERLTSIAQFERVAVDLSGIADWREAMDAIEGQLATARATTRSPHLVARLSLTGRTPLAWQLRRDRDLVLTEAEQRAEGIGATWIEKLEISAQAPSEQGNGSAADPVLELGALMLADIGANSAARLEVRQLVEDLRNDLPAEIRGFAGKDEAELEAFVERLLSEGSQDIVARLRHDGAGNH